MFLRLAQAGEVEGPKQRRGHVQVIPPSKFGPAVVGQL